MITDNTAKWQVKSLNTPIANSGDGKLPVGHIYISMGSSAPAGSLPLWGQLFSRSTYKDLWDWVNKHPEQLLSESDWQTKYIENNGLVPYYSEGTDSTNFRVPNCLNLGSDMMDYVVEENQSPYSWYRVWKSGWVEQGGEVVASKGGTSVKVELSKPMKNTTYYVHLLRIFGSTTTDATSVMPSVVKRETEYVTLNTVNTTFNTVWTVNGYGRDIPQTERVLWCVKAFGNIDEGTGSTSLDSIATNIAQLNTKVDGFASGLVDSHATAIAKMQSYFNGSYEKTLLAGSETTRIDSGNITLSDSWKNYDGLLIYFTNDGNTMLNSGRVIWKWDIENTIALAISGGKTRFQLGSPDNGEYWYFTTATSTEITLITNTQSSGIQAIYGIRLKANGITNKSAIDVSQISDKISSLLTSDNHLRLPSGLEVW